MMFFVGVTSAGAAEKKAEAPNLCRAGERVFFSCRVEAKGEKIVSLCASEGFGDRGGKLAGRLEYRFGTRAKVDLVYPPAGADLRQVFDYSRYTRSMVSLIGFGFHNGGYRYELYEEYNAEDDPDASSDHGVRVVGKDGEGKRTELPCVGPVTDRLMKLEDLGFRHGP